MSKRDWQLRRRAASWLVAAMEDRNRLLRGEIAGKIRSSSGEGEFRFERFFLIAYLRISKKITRYGRLRDLVNWNACSLKSTIIKLSGFLEEKQIDVAFIIKTHLKPEVGATILNSRLVWLDRTNIGGGVAIATSAITKQHRLPSADVKKWDFEGKQFGISKEKSSEKMFGISTGKHQDFSLGIICNFYN